MPRRWQEKLPWSKYSYAFLRINTLDVLRVFITNAIYKQDNTIVIQNKQNMLGITKKTFQDLRLQLPLSEIRKRARILVIDDDEQAFPSALLLREGYNVVYWPRVESLRELESGEYDLIVLDINGVASAEISTNDGLGVLDHIKKCNPAQLVIAYSGKQYDLSQSSFWRIADDFLGKPSSLITCKEKIDALLKTKFTPEHYWDEITKIIIESGVSQRNIRKFESQIVSTIKRQKVVTTETIERQLSIAHHTAAIIGVLLQIIYRFYESR